MSDSIAHATETARSRYRKPMSLSVEKIRELMFALLVFGVVFFNLTSLRPDKMEVGLDVFVVLKMMITGACGLVGLHGFLCNGDVRRLLTHAPGAWLLALVGVFAVSAVLSLSPVQSLASAGALACILLFTTTALVTIGRQRVLSAALLGIACFILGSWYAFLFVPEIGVWFEGITGGEQRARMSGLSHPNTLGQYSAMGIGLIVILASQKRLHNRAWFAILVLGLAALILSLSRGSSIALFVALVFVYRDRILALLGPIGIVGLLTMISMLLFVSALQTNVFGEYSQRVFELISKSGEASEISTLTGRTAIWEFAIERIKERPLTGFGLTTSKEIFKDHYRYTHNLWLNVAFSGGLVGLMLMLGLTIGRVRAALTNPDRIADFIIVLIFVNGLIENVIFAYIPSAPTLLFVVAVLWRKLELDSGPGSS